MVRFLNPRQVSHGACRMFVSKAAQAAQIQIQITKKRSVKQMSSEVVCPNKDTCERSSQSFREGFGEALCVYVSISSIHV